MLWQSIEGEAKVITTLHPEAVPFLYGGFKDVFLFTPIFGEMFFQCVES